MHFQQRVNGVATQITAVATRAGVIAGQLAVLGTHLINVHLSIGNLFVPIKAIDLQFANFILGLTHHVRKPGGGI